MKKYRIVKYWRGEHPLNRYPSGFFYEVQEKILLGFEGIQGGFKSQEEAEEWLELYKTCGIVKEIKK